MRRSSIIFGSVMGGLFVILLAAVFTNQLPELWQSHPIQNVNTEIEKIDTSDWVTYRDEVLGIEFKYPSGWAVKMNGENHIILVAQHDKETYAQFKVGTVEINTSELLINTHLLEYVKNKWTWEIEHFHLSPRISHNGNDVSYVEVLNAPGEINSNHYYILSIDKKIIIEFSSIKRGGQQYLPSIIETISLILPE